MIFAAMPTTDSNAHRGSFSVRAREVLRWDKPGGRRGGPAIRTQPMSWWGWLLCSWVALELVRRFCDGPGDADAGAVGHDLDGSVGNSGGVLTTTL